MHVLVIGAGPTGLTAALELRRRGIGAEIVDRRAEGLNLSRAVGILPASIDLLGPSGAAAELLAEGVAYDGLRLHQKDRLIADLRFAAVGDGDRFILGLPQDRTEAILAGRLAAHGGQVRYGMEVTGLRQTVGAVAVTFGDGTVRQYDHVLAADGVRSTVRGILGLPFDGTDLPHEWSIADVEAAGWRYPQSFSLFLIEAGGMAVVAPMAPGRYRVVANRPDALATLPVSLDVSRIRRQATFRISVRQLRSYSVGRVHLAGDAAHCHSPVGGRGMNLGIADAACFAWRLAEGTVEHYSAERHAEGQKAIRLSEAVRNRLEGETAAKRAPVRLLAWMANRSAGVERLAMRRALGM
jgi:2-polyprenyl-6-methoxyphenol hydroxylase-like FAD-dependent oxidoreductase